MMSPPPIPVTTAGLTARQWDRLIQHYVENPPLLADPPTLDQTVAAATIAAGRTRRKPLPHDLLLEAERTAAYLRSHQQEPE